MACKEPDPNAVVRQALQAARDRISYYDERSKQESVHPDQVSARRKRWNEMQSDQAKLTLDLIDAAVEMLGESEQPRVTNALNQVRNCVRSRVPDLRNPDEQLRREAIIAVSAALLQVGAAIRLIVEDADEIHGVVNEAIGRWGKHDKSRLLIDVLRDDDRRVKFERS